MSSSNNGGPAFPSFTKIKDPVLGELNEPFAGMSLRDWFAGQALAGLCANANDEIVSARLSMPASDARQVVSVACYAMADAMLIRSALVEAPDTSPETPVPGWVSDFLNRRVKVEGALRKGQPLSPEEMKRLAVLLSVPSEYQKATADPVKEQIADALKASDRCNHDMLHVLVSIISAVRAASPKLADRFQVEADKMFETWPRTETAAALAAYEKEAHRG